METPFLQRGCQGQYVLDLQCSLTAAGAYTGNLDGNFGTGTEAALIAFQKSSKLASPGTLDAATAQALHFQYTQPTTCSLPDVSLPSVIRLFPGTARSNIELNLPYVLNAMAEAKLADKQMLSVALATIRVEASCFLPISEFPSSFNTSSGGKPFDLYNNRSVLGNKGEPDGERFRGRGFVQLTGRANFLQLGKEVGLGEELVNCPLKAHEPAIAAKVLSAFLRARESRIRTALKQNRLEEVRRLVNGGNNGLAEFKDAFYLGMQLLPERLAA